MKLTKESNILIVFVCAILIVLTIVSIPTVTAATTLAAVEDFEVEFDNDVDLTWSKVSGCSGYEIQFTKDSTFESGVETIVIANASTSSYTIKDTIEPDDTYFFRIRAYINGSTKTYSEWTEPYSFYYNLYVPTLYWAYIYEDTIKVNYSSSYIYDVDGYEVQYSPSSNFTSIQDTIVVEDRSTLIEFANDSCKPNTDYFFRVRSYRTINGKKYYSQWSEVEYDSYKMETPYIKDIQVGEHSVSIEWSPTLAPQYILQISHTKSFADALEFTALTNNKHTVDLILKSDVEYYVRVKADRPEIGQSEWSNANRFTYTLDKCKFDDMQVVDDDIIMKWTSHELYDGCEIQYSEYSNLSVAETYTVSKDKVEYILKDMNPGTYHLRIRYYDNVNAMFYGEQVNYSAWSPIITVQVKPEIPSLNDVVIEPTNFQVQFNPVEKVTGYEVQVSDSPTFENASEYSTWSATATSYKHWDELVPNRTYYFRIRSFVDTKSSDCYSNWSDYLTASYSLTKTYIKTQKVENNKIVFDWKNVSNHDGYQIKYGLDPELIDAETVNISASYTTKYTIENPQPGTYYFKIRTVHTVDKIDYYSDWSNTKSISFKLPKTYLTNQYVDNNKIHVVWKNVGDAIYEIQYSRTKDFADSKSVSITTANTNKEKLEHTINDTDLIPGQYYIRIRTGNKSGNETYYSDWSNAKTVNYKLNKTYIKTLSIENGQVKVKWKTMDGCTGYQIQYGTDASLNNGTILDITDLNQDVYYLDSAPGTQYARIRIYKIVDGETYCSDWSNIKEITFKLTKTYLTNQYMSNGTGHIVWKAVDGVDGYQIQISNDADFLISNTTTEWIFDPKTNQYDGFAVVPGTTYFRIRTIKYVEETTFDPENKPTVTPRPYYSDWSNAKTLVNSSTTSSISSVFSQYNKLYIQWTKNLNVSGYELQYCTDPNFVQNVQSKETLANDITQDALSVAPGTYYIRVRTYQKTSDGKTYSTWSSVTAFEFKFDSVQLKAEANDNNIDLSWTVSKGCHGYQIEYSTDATFESNVKTLQIVNTNTIEHVIQNLQSGSYNIRIRAYKNINNVKYYSDWSIAETIIIQ